MKTTWMTLIWNCERRLIYDAPVSKRLVFFKMKSPEVYGFICLLYFYWAVLENINIVGTWKAKESNNFITLAYYETTATGGNMPNFIDRLCYSRGCDENENCWTSLDGCIMTDVIKMNLCQLSKIQQKSNIREF